MRGRDLRRIREGGVEDEEIGEGGLKRIMLCLDSEMEIRIEEIQNKTKKGTGTQLP
jgi:hypothetical protein